MPLVRDGTGSRGLDKEVVVVTASMTVNQSHSGRVLQCNAAADITLTLPADLKPGFAFEVEQIGAGQVIFAAASNGTLRQRATGDRTAGLYARARCEVSTNTRGTNAAWTLAGDVAASGDAVIASVSWSVAAGASNVCVMTGTIKDAGGNTIATGATVTTGSTVITLTSNKAWRITTHTDGTFAISITASGKPATEYGVAIIPSLSKLSVSAASAALWG